MTENIQHQPAVRLATSDTIESRASASRPRRARRHWILALSFILIVLLPTGTGVTYLYTQAADQFHSNAAFAVRSEETTNPLDVLSAFTQTGASSAPDSEVLYDYIRSQTLIEKIEETLNIRAIFNRAENDPLFTLGEDKSVEDLLSYWERMVLVSIDSNTGVLSIEVRAFYPDDARTLLTEIISKSSELVEELSRIARNDAMKYALEDLSLAEDRLKIMRLRFRDFRSEYQIIDPETNVESQIGVITQLQAILADTLIDFETVRSYSGEDDLRLASLQRRINAIRDQIEAEQQVMRGKGENAKPLSEIFGEYEELLVDLEFSRNAYTATLAAEEQARFEARRKNRYLAVHIPPTLAQESIYPDRELLSLLILICSLATWGVLVMIYYNVRDRG